MKKNNKKEEEKKKNKKKKNNKKDKKEDKEMEKEKKKFNPYLRKNKDQKFMSVLTILISVNLHFSQRDIKKNLK